MANARERRCQAQNRRGERCAATVVNAKGYCVAHDPERPADMRALGRASAKARRRPKPERVHPSLRDFLKAEVPPARVWRAIEMALEGENESARVSASRLLIDALHEPAEQQDWRERMKGEMAAAREKFDELIRRKVEEVDARREQLGEELQPVIEFIAEQYAASGLQVPFDIPAERCEALLQDLVAIGLIAPPDETAELSRLRGEVDRLQAQLAAIPEAVRQEFAVT